MVSNPLAADQAVQVSVGADTSEFRREMNSASRSTRGFKSKLGTLSSVLVGGAAVAGVGVVAGLGKAAQAAANFEESMVDVRRVTGEGVGDALRDDIQAMSEEMPQTQDQLAGIAATAGRLGVEGADNINQFTETVAKISTATNLASDEAADSFARIATLTEEPIENVGHLGDTVNALSNNMGASAREITDSMTRASGTLTQLGLSTEEIAGLSAAMNEVSSSSRIAGTQLRRLGQEMLDPKKTEDLAAALGMTTEQFESMREEDPNEILVQMAATMEEGGEQADTLRETLSTTSRQALAGLGQNLESVKEAQTNANEAFEEGGSLQEEFAEANSTTQSALQRLENKLRNVGIEIGEELLPYVNDAIDAFSEGIDVVSEFVTENETLQSVIDDIGGAIGDVTDTVTAFGDDSEGAFDDIRSSLSASGAFVSSFAAGEWKNAFEDLTDVADNVFGGLETLLVGENGSGGVLNTAVSRGGEFLRTDFRKILKAAASAAVENTITAFTTFETVLIGPDGESGVLSAMVDEGAAFLRNTAPKLIGDAAEAIGSGIRQGLIDMTNPLRGKKSELWDILIDSSKWLINNMDQLMLAVGAAISHTIVEGVTGLFEGLVGNSVVKDEIARAGTWLINNMGKVIGDVGGAIVSAIVGGVVGLPAALVGTGAEAAGVIGGAIVDAGAWVKNTGKEILSGAADVAATAFRGIADPIVEDVKAAVETAQDALNSGVEDPGGPPNTGTGPGDLPEYDYGYRDPGGGRENTGGGGKPGIGGAKDVYTPGDTVTINGREVTLPGDETVRVGGKIYDFSDATFDNPVPDVSDVPSDDGPDYDTPRYTGPRPSNMTAAATGGLVARTGAALIHEGERVVPASQVTDRGEVSVDMEPVVRELRAVRKAVEREMDVDVRVDGVGDRYAPI